MVSLGALFRLGFSSGRRRFRGRHLAKKTLSTAAPAANQNQFLELQQQALLPGPCSSVVGETHWQHGLFLGLKAQLQNGEPYHQNVDPHAAMVGHLDKGTRSLLPCDEGFEQNLGGYWGRTRTPLSCYENISKVETFLKSRSDSYLSAQEHPSDGRESPDERKSQDSGQESHSCGRGGRVHSTVESVQVSASGLEELLGLEVHDESGIVNHVVPCNLEVAAILAKPPRLKNKQSKSRSELPRRPLKSCSSTSGKWKPPGREGFGGVMQKPRLDAKNVYILNRQISILMETGYRQEAFAVYEKILPAGCKPDSYTYLHLIKGLCEGGELAEAWELFRKVLAGEEALACGRSEVILYNAMVHGLGSAGFVKDALNLVEEMRGRGFMPDLYTYNSILFTLGKAGKLIEALTLFESMADKGCTPDVVTYNSLISCLGKAGKAMEAYKLYEGMMKEGCLPDHVTFNTLIPVLGKAGELALAINLYEFMTTIGCEPDVYTYTSLVTSLCRANRIDEALLLSVEMTEKGCAPNTVTFNSWLDGLCKGGRVVEAQLLFHKMLVLGYIPDKITYCILIDAFCKTGQFVDKSFDLLKDLLKCSTCTLDSRTSEIVYQSFRKVGMLKQAKRIARNARAKQLRCVGSGLKVLK